MNFFFEIPMKYNENLQIKKRDSETTSTDDSIASGKFCPF